MNLKEIEYIVTLAEEGNRLAPRKDFLSPHPH